MRWLVRICHHGDCSAMVPDLPGCVAAGSSLEETLELIKEAISLHIDMMRRSGEEVPTPAKVVDLDIEELEEGELCTWVEVDSQRVRRKPVARE
jgi:predicted RNase H-like HicB family nuclease